jgi:hypothetical protein
LCDVSIAHTVDEGGGEPSTEAGVGDALEDLEGVLRCPLVVLVPTDDGPERIGRHDPPIPERRCGPRRFAGAGRADEDHEARVGEPEHGAVSSASGDVHDLQTLS